MDGLILILHVLIHVGAESHRYNLLGLEIRIEFRQNLNILPCKELQQLEMNPCMKVHQPLELKEKIRYVTRND